jgi:N-acetylneuraminic acid mutarotase
MMRCRRATVVLLFVFSFSISVSMISWVRADDDYWTSKTPMQQPRGGLGVAAVNGKVYAIGGSNVSGLYPPDLNGGFVGTNEEYDPETDSWTFKAAMPTPRAYFAIAVCQNKIYCIGGTADIGLDEIYHLFPTYINSGVNEVYDPATDTWETKTPMPIARRDVEAHVVYGKIYVIGENLNEVYDPATDTWTTKSPMPDVATHFVSAVFDGKIYVVATNVYTLDAESERWLFVYDAKSDSWSQGTPAPTDVRDGAAVATTGIMASKRLYVLGVDSGREPPRVNHVYDPEIDSWTSGTTVLTNRNDFGCAVVNDKLYTVGGYTFDNNPNSGHVTASVLNEQYTPIGYGTPDPSYVPPDTVAPVTEYPQATFIGIAVGASLAAVAVGLILHFKKGKANPKNAKESD